MKKVAPNSKFVGLSTEIILQSQDILFEDFFKVKRVYVKTSLKAVEVSKINKNFSLDGFELKILHAVQSSARHRRPVT